jgi:hypothetical protein
MADQLPSDEELTLVEELPSDEELTPVDPAEYQGGPGAAFAISSLNAGGFGLPMKTLALQDAVRAHGVTGITSDEFWDKYRTQRDFYDQGMASMRDKEPVASFAGTVLNPQLLAGKGAKALGGAAPSMVKQASGPGMMYGAVEGPSDLTKGEIAGTMGDALDSGAVAGIAAKAIGGVSNWAANRSGMVDEAMTKAGIAKKVSAEAAADQPLAVHSTMQRKAANEVLEGLGGAGNVVEQATGSMEQIAALEAQGAITPAQAHALRGAIPKAVEVEGRNVLSRPEELARQAPIRAHVPPTDTFIAAEKSLIPSMKAGAREIGRGVIKSSPVVRGVLKAAKNNSGPTRKLGYDSVKVILQRNPNHFGQAGQSLMSAIQKDAETGSDNEAKAVFYSLSTSNPGFQQKLKELQDGEDTADLIQDAADWTSR